MKKQIHEVDVGEIASGNVISPEKFRPTKAQSMVMKNLDSLITSGRENIQEQDVLNIPIEDIEEQNLTIRNIDGAYEILRDLKLININAQGNVEFTDAGQIVLDNIKQFEPEEEPDADEETPLDGELGAEPTEEEPLGGEAEPEGEVDLELSSFNLLANLNDLSKFIRG